jgi:hypothetical protein
MAWETVAWLMAARVCACVYAHTRVLACMHISGSVQGIGSIKQVNLLKWLS